MLKVCQLLKRLQGFHYKWQRQNMFVILLLYTYFLYLKSGHKQHPEIPNVSVWQSYLHTVIKLHLLHCSETEITTLV